jgi:hypothetical protein
VFIIVDFAGYNGHGRRFLRGWPDISFSGAGLAEDDFPEGDQSVRLMRSKCKGDFLNADDP